MAKQNILIWFEDYATPAFRLLASVADGDYEITEPQPCHVSFPYLLRFIAINGDTREIGQFATLADAQLGTVV